MSFLYHILSRFCALLGQEGERLQDHWSSGYHFDSDPRFPPFLLYVRWKSGVTFVRRCFRDVTSEEQNNQRKKEYSEASD